MLYDVIVDRAVLSAFKRRALRSYPHERMEQVLGHIKSGNAFIYAFRDVEHLGTRDGIIVADDYNPMDDGKGDTPLSILGTIHTHPDAGAEPSDMDLQSAAEDQEKMFGICGISKTKKRRFVSWAFYDAAGNPLHLVIGE